MYSSTIAIYPHLETIFGAHRTSKVNMICLFGKPTFVIQSYRNATDSEKPRAVFDQKLQKQKLLPNDPMMEYNIFPIREREREDGDHKWSK